MSQAWLGADHVTVLPASLQDLLAFNEMPEYTANERGNRLRAKVDRTSPTHSPWNAPSRGELTNHLFRLLSQDDPLCNKQASTPAVPLDRNYLADGVLDACIGADEAAAFRLKDAIDTFKRAEDEVFAYLAAIQASLSGETVCTA
jgi:hypothetical protein